MTDSTTKWPRLVLATVAATTLVVASCEAPRPEPLAPGASLQPKPEPTIADVSKPFHEYQVESKASMKGDSPTPKYPDLLPQAGVEGEVLVSFVVDESGAADQASFKVIRATHELFATAVKAALPAMRFVPAQIGGKNVKQFVEAPFTFTLPVIEKQMSEQEKETVVSAHLDASKQGKKLAFTIEKPVREDVLYRATTSDSTGGKTLAFRVDKTPRGAVIRRENTLREWEANELPNVLVRSKSGEELKRFIADPTKMYNRTPLNDLNPDDIAAIEVIKARNCSVTVGVPCPAIIVTIKSGREAAYRRK
jgi:TonB family protein